VNVDFAPPKDYKEEKKTKPSSKPQLGDRKVEQAAEEEEPPVLQGWGSSSSNRGSSSSYFKKLTVMLTADLA